MALVVISINLSCFKTKFYFIKNNHDLMSEYLFCTYQYRWLSSRGGRGHQCRWCPGWRGANRRSRAKTGPVGRVARGRWSTASTWCSCPPWSAGCCREKEAVTKDPLKSTPQNANAIMSTNTLLQLHNKGAIKLTPKSEWVCGIRSQSAHHSKMIILSQLGAGAVQRNTSKY